MQVKKDETGVLATDFSGMEEENKNWENDRNLKIEIWRAYQKRILFLKDMLSYEGYFNYKWIIQKEIKKLKKQQKRFEVEPIISFAPEREIKVKKKKKV